MSYHPDLLSASPCGQAYLKSLSSEQRAAVERTRKGLLNDVPPERWTQRQVHEAIAGIVPTWSEDGDPTYQTNIVVNGFAPVTR